ncbi:MAG: inorganic pyrophosphatase [Candidatus Ryanbacteria bacterium RIFCSPHIGHO2_02_FULL_45_17b]|uniref:inorganic diphosphatase n=1 Tax=Candidatus Ryanbacteria bacterium RIFCSPHIGHO2_01_FULL_45_22 TaxID=1802114 RepID=A0A1G2G1R0_9BACT|nr:MAG: inorganic pyrophosphatase [Candidatus Ryanbacteria bacterium RIFCSPHIGHO2_01_FULL_45_22]OGZ46964.1 MAG: inorganic pyrophosphatase [Candidatus Ryanbacteria bacterium RIFCSPHIGHO2_02_FULL_45_17b]
MQDNTKQSGNYATQFIGKEVEIIIDRPLHSKHPKYGFVYEINYGFIPNTKAPDGEGIDAYLLGIDDPVETYTGKCIAVVHRLNDADDKLVVIPVSLGDVDDEEIRRSTHFQEQFFTSEIIRETDE